VPRLSDLKLTPGVFAAAASGATIARAARTGTTVNYSDTEAATTIFTVSRLLVGVPRGRRCLTPPKHARSKGGKSCTRLQRVGSFTDADRAGRNSFRFTGRLAGGRLSPGRYQLAATPRAPGATGKTIAHRSASSRTRRSMNRPQDRAAIHEYHAEANGGVAQHALRARANPGNTRSPTLELAVR
jgi:hypothetical protein